MFLQFQLQMKEEFRIKNITTQFFFFLEKEWKMEALLK